MEVGIRPYKPEHLEAIVALSLRARKPVFASVKENFDPELYDYYYPDWQAHQTKDVTEAQMEICMIGTGADPGHGPARLSYKKSGFKPWHNVIYFKKLKTSD